MHVALVFFRRKFREVFLRGVVCGGVIHDLRQPTRRLSVSAETQTKEPAGPTRQQQRPGTSLICCPSWSWSSPSAVVTDGTRRGQWSSQPHLRVRRTSYLMFDRVPVVAPNERVQVFCLTFAGQRRLQIRGLLGLPASQPLSGRAAPL